MNALLFMLFDCVLEEDRETYGEGMGNGDGEGDGEGMGIGIGRFRKRAPTLLLMEIRGGG